MTIYADPISISAGMIVYPTNGNRELVLIDSPESDKDSIMNATDPYNLLQTKIVNAKQSTAPLSA